MEEPNDTPRMIFINIVHLNCQVQQNLYSNENKEHQKEIIELMDNSIKKYKQNFYQFNIENIIPLFFAMIKLAHPIFIKYIKEKMNINDCLIYDKKIYDVKKEVKEILEYLYTQFYYSKNKVNNSHIQEIIDEYAKIFDVKYEKIIYE